MRDVMYLGSAPYGEDCASAIWPARRGKRVALPRCYRRSGFATVLPRRWVDALAAKATGGQSKSPAGAGRADQPETTGRRDGG